MIFCGSRQTEIDPVISNVMNDAVKFTNDGTITVTIKVKKKGAGKEEDSEIIAIIKDTGSGIDPEIMPKLFSKFATKSHKGMGLGLYISHKILSKLMAIGFGAKTTRMERAPHLLLHYHSSARKILHR